MSEKKKTKYDMNSPEAKALIDEIVHGTFTKEGTMAAFPTCFPGASIPIPADESHITALDVSGDGMIYGGTSGRATHLFVGIFHGVTGVVFDRGTVEGANHCAAVCCGKSRFVACVNGPGGGRVVAGGFEGLPFDLIQEWGFGRPPFQELGKVNGEPIVHAVADCVQEACWSAPPAGTCSPWISKEGSIKIVGEVPGSGRLALGSKGGIFGQDGSAHLWRYDACQRGSSSARRLRSRKAPGARSPLTWAKDHHSGLLYTADADGNLFSLDEERGFSGPLARTLLAPVGPMAVTHDGRVFGFCGPEMAKMFCYNPRNARGDQPGRCGLRPGAPPLRLRLRRRGDGPRRPDHLRRGRRPRAPVALLPENPEHLS